MDIPFYEYSPYLVGILIFVGVFALRIRSHKAHQRHVHRRLKTYLADI